MKNRNKIKVPAYAFGNATNREMAGLVAYDNGVAYNPLQSSITRGIAPNNSNNFKQNVAANTSSFDMSGAISQLPQAIGLLSNPFNTSTATSDSEATIKSLTDIAQGASIGMSVGGPIGAGVGALVGSIGSKGKEANMTSFTDYDEGTLGTGLFGLFGNGKLKRERRRIKTNAYNNRTAVRGTEYLAGEAAEDNALMNTAVYAANGGVIPSLAYVDDGELLQTPDGRLSEIPEEGKPTDSNLVSIPDGTRVLSDKIKFPGTKKTIAQIGKEMMTSKKSKFNDKYAENANKLNQMNNQMIYDKLFDIQEQIKLQQGIQPKTKNIDSFVDGGEKIKPVRSWGGIKLLNNRGPSKSYGRNEEFEWNGRTYIVTGPGTYKPVNTKKNVRDMSIKGDIGWPTQFNPVEVDRSGKYPSRYGVNGVQRGSTLEDAYNTSFSTGDMLEYSNGKVKTVIDPYGLYPKNNKHKVATTDNNSSGTYTSNRYIDGQSTNTYTTTHSTNSGNKTSAVNAVNTGNNNTNTSNRNRVVTKSKTESVPAKITSKHIDKLNADIGEMAGIVKYVNGKAVNPLASTKVDTLNKHKINIPHKGNTQTESGFNLSNLLSDAATVAPIISNLFGGDAEYVQAQYNPYADTVRNAMARRRFNTDPALQSLYRNRAIANYNASQLNTNTGAGMAQRLQTAANLDRALTDLYSQESNINNQYLGDYANMLNNLGQQYVTATNLAAEQNAQNRAINRNIRRTGLSQLSQYAQNKQLMRNQAMNDKAMLGLYENFLKSGYSDQDINRFKQWINKGGMSYAG